MTTVNVSAVAMTADRIVEIAPEFEDLLGFSGGAALFALPSIF